MKLKRICYRSNLFHCTNLYYDYMLISVKMLCISRREMQKFSMNLLF